MKRSKETVNDGSKSFGGALGSGGGNARGGGGGAIELTFSRGGFAIGQAIVTEGVEESSKVRGGRRSRRREQIRKIGGDKGPAMAEKGFIGFGTSEGGVETNAGERGMNREDGVGGVVGWV